jgi:LacI family transcriptional regulator
LGQYDTLIRFEHQNDEISIIYQIFCAKVPIILLTVSFFPFILKRIIKAVPKGYFENMDDLTNLKDVAEYTGLSMSTISRVLSNKGYVKKNTRQKVLEAVQTLNYSPNIMAQSLKMGRSNTIALMIPSIQNLIFPDITRGVEDTARKNGYTVILCNTDENIELEKSYISVLRPRLIDGFIFTAVNPDAAHIINLREANFPIVLLSRSCKKKIDAIIIDNKKAAYNATKYLIERGHKKILLSLGDTELTLYAERYMGYQQALEEYNIPFDETLIVKEQYRINSFYYLVQNMLESGIKPDAVFATTDAQAIIIMRALYDAGLSIPGDVSVVGFDNVEIASMVEPPLTTVSQPLYEMGVLAAQKLIYQIQYKAKYGVLDKPTIDILETNLIIRKSTR